MHNRFVRQDSFGSDLRVWTVGGVRISETLMPAGLQLEEHAHDAGQICFVLEGTYVERLAGAERRLAPGAMHMRGPGEPHANSFDRDVLTLLISVDRSRWNVPLLFEDVSRAMRQTDFLPRAEPEWLGDAISLIERRYSEPLCLSSIASAVGVRRGALAAGFRRFRSTSVGEAIRAVRVATAKELLATNLPLTEIAWRCGFHDQAHFTRVFRRVAGVTPGAYRSKSSK